MTDPKLFARYFYSHPAFGETYYKLDDGLAFASAESTEVFSEVASTPLVDLIRSNLTDHVPYHGFIHSIVTTELAFHIAYNVYRLPIEDCICVMLAGYLHDIGHQGFSDDQINIHHSCKLATRLLMSDIGLKEVSLEDRIKILEAIRATRFVRGANVFPDHDVNDLIGHCVHVADLLNCLTYNWPDLFVCLAEEMNVCIDNMSDFYKFAEQNFKFLRSVFDRGEFGAELSGVVLDYLTKMEIALEFWSKGIHGE